MGLHFKSRTVRTFRRYYAHMIYYRPTLLSGYMDNFTLFFLLFFFVFSFLSFAIRSASTASLSFTYNYILSDISPIYLLPLTSICKANANIISSIEITHRSSGLCIGIHFQPIPVSSFVWCSLKSLYDFH